MKYRTRTYYTDGQKALMWERWRDGWTLHQIAHLFNRAHTSVRGVLAQTGGIRPPPRRRCAIALTLAEREEIYARWQKASRCARSPHGSGERHPPSAVRSDAMAVKRTIEPPQQTTLPGIVRCGPNAANWPRTELWRASWPTSCGWRGHRNKSPGGSSILTRATRAIACHTRPSTAASSSRRVAP